MGMLECAVGEKSRGFKEKAPGSRNRMASRWRRKMRGRAANHILSDSGGEIAASR